MQRSKEGAVLDSCQPIVLEEFADLVSQVIVSYIIDDYVPHESTIPERTVRSVLFPGAETWCLFSLGLE